jgi:hypothetical protein
MEPSISWFMRPEKSLQLGEKLDYEPSICWFMGPEKKDINIRTFCFFSVYYVNSFISILTICYLRLTTNNTYIHINTGGDLIKLQDSLTEHQIHHQQRITAASTYHYTSNKSNAWTSRFQGKQQRR